MIDRLPLKVLIVEDTLSDYQLIQAELRRAEFDLDHIRVDTETDYRAMLDLNTWDVILCDYRLPGFDGIAALTIRNERQPDTPFILVSGQMGEDVAVEAMLAGADDYLLKDRLSRLGLATRRAVERARDRLDKKRAEARVEELRRALLTTVHHEFRTPVTYLVGYATILQDNSLTEDVRRQALSGLKKGSDRVLSLIDKILEMANILYSEAAGLFERHRESFTDWIGVVRVIVDRYEASYQAKGLTLTFHIEDRLLPVLVYPPHLIMVINNLVDNAIKFTDRGTIGVRVMEHNQGVLIQVHDTGIGIDADQLSQVFLEFSQIDRPQREQQGPGLGLAIAYGLVNIHGGQMSVESKPGDGSIFQFWLPYLIQTEGV